MWSYLTYPLSHGRGVLPDSPQPAILILVFRKHWNNETFRRIAYDKHYLLPDTSSAAYYFMKHITKNAENKIDYNRTQTL